jgi:hypothetical protein
MLQVKGFFESNHKRFQDIMRKNEFVISVETHASEICHIIDEIASHAQINMMRNQVKTYHGAFQGYAEAKKESLGDYQLLENPTWTMFKDDSSLLGSLQFVEVNQIHASFARDPIHIKSDKLPDHKLVLKFEAVDTDELKNIDIVVNGDRAFFKIGEGETAHYHIPNDKKLWETQLMVQCIGGNYFLRDMGFVHNSRVKLDHKCEVRIQQGCVVDLGKVVHYHFDKVVHAVEPSTQSNQRFYVLRPNEPYESDADDFPFIRARPIWVSADENEENIQNEIHVNADGTKNTNTLGRSMKRDIQIKLKAVSADHCQIAYHPENGWSVSEKGKDKLSSNGTYIFLKEKRQMQHHMPSDLIPIQDDMIISFVNYELRVRLEKKTPEEMQSQEAEQARFFEELEKRMMTSAVAIADVEEQKVVEEHQEEREDPVPA